MSNPNFYIKDKIIHWFICHPWLKVISLILAVVVWFYVKGELKQFNY